MDYLLKVLTEIAVFYNEMAIYLVLGFAVAGLLHVLFPEEFVFNHLGGNSFKSVLKSSLFGIPLPLCSCGVIPVAASLRRKGASKGATLSFLISTPQVGADSFMITYSLIGWVFAVFRVAAAAVTALIAGLAANFFAKRETDQQPVRQINTQHVHEGFSDRAHRLFSYVQNELLGSIANAMVVGIIVAGLIGVIVPDDFFANYMSNQFLSMLIMLVISVPLYICATSSTPIAASLIMKGMSPGAALVLLLAGPATNAVTIATVSKTLGKRMVIVYLASISVVSVGLGFAMNNLFADMMMTHAHNHSSAIASWIKIAGSVILTVMLLWHYVYNVIRPRLKKAQPALIGYKTMQVSGMTCNHCKASVEKAVSGIEGTSDVMANLANGTVQFKYNGNNMQAIAQAIQNQGFNVPQQENKMTRFTIKVQGMTCNHCKASVEKAVNSVDGTADVVVDLAAGTASFDYNNSDLTAIEEAIKDKGFDVVPS